MTIKFDIRDRWSGKVLFSADIECASDASNALKLGLAVRRAYLSGAYLGGADLGKQWIVQGTSRSDGYPFFLQMLTGDTEPMIKAGCRHFTVAQAQAHWTATRGNTALGRETENIVRSMFELARIRKLVSA